jgi:anti-sigma regulatory factor (Ser/Thr protein kinase)
MEELSLHILDIVENSIAAGAGHVEIRIREDRQQDLLRIEIVDDGRGMNEATLARAADPFFTTRTTRRVGLGVSLFEQAARATGGDFKVESSPGAGTKVTGTFRLSDIDRQPLGDMGGTLLSLIVGNPQVEFSYIHQADGGEVSFTSGEVKAQLAGIPINSAEGIAAVRKSLEGMRQQVPR